MRLPQPGSWPRRKRWQQRVGSSSRFMRRSPELHTSLPAAEATAVHLNAFFFTPRGLSDNDLRPRRVRPPQTFRYNCSRCCCYNLLLLLISLLFPLLLLLSSSSSRLKNRVYCTNRTTVLGAIFKEHGPDQRRKHLRIFSFLSGRRNKRIPLFGKTFREFLISKKIFKNKIVSSNT